MKNAVIVAVIPRFVRQTESKNYYAELTNFLEDRGYQVVVNPEQLDATVQQVVDSKGIIIFSNWPMDDVSQWPNALSFGGPDGITHPVARNWYAEGAQGIPPVELYTFTADQKLAIDQLIEQIEQDQANLKIKLPRQAASERPKVR